MICRITCNNVPAYEYICKACVSMISFSYDEPSLITVYYNGSADTIRQLQTGARIVIVTTDDDYPYPFVIGDTPPTTSQFTVQSIGVRETIFSSSRKADLLLMGAQYEISNFCKANFESKHNSSYWHNQAYIGIGPGAHSYIPSVRSANISNNALYIKHIDDYPNNISQNETLTIIDQYNEYILTRLNY